MNRAHESDRPGIVALDFSDWSSARALIDTLGDEVGFYKVGLELYVSAGPDAVRKLKDLGKRVFLDLKLHDIPNTVAGATRSARELGADLLTVHAGGGEEMIRAAAENAGDDLRVVAVTALTSISPNSLPAQYRRDLPLNGIVLELTQDAISAGAAGVVLSGHEVSQVKTRFGDRCLCVVPGIRPAGSDTHDQSRVVTPQSALRDGADYLVIGRVVNKSRDPVRSWRDLWSLGAPA